MRTSGLQNGTDRVRDDSLRSLAGLDTSKPSVADTWVQLKEDSHRAARVTLQRTHEGHLDEVAEHHRSQEAPCWVAQPSSCDRVGILLQSRGGRHHGLEHRTATCHSN